MKIKKLNEYIIDLRKITFSNRDKANTLINDKNLITYNLKAFLPVQLYATNWNTEEHRYRNVG